MGAIRVTKILGVAGVDELGDQAIIDLIRLIDAERCPIGVDDAHDLCAAFWQVQERGLHLDSDLLARWIGTRCQVAPQPGIAAIGAALGNDSPAVRQALRATMARRDPPENLVPVLDARTLERVGDAVSPESVRMLEDNRRARVLSARALGLLHDTQSADAMVDFAAELDPKEHTAEFGFVTVALEMLGEASVAPRLQAMIPTADVGQAYWLTRAVEKLTGHSLPPPEGEPEGLRADWAGIDLTAAPTPRVDLLPISPSLSEAVVTNGHAMYALAPDDPTWNTCWPEWDFSWCHDRSPLYQLGSGCGTCEVVLWHVGWSPDKAVELAQVVRQEVGDVTDLSGSLLDALIPLLELLASGRYQIRLVDLALEPVPWSATWFAVDAPFADTLRRRVFGDGSEDVAAGFADVSPAERFYQPAGGVTKATPLVIAPTQPDSALDPAVIARYKTAIIHGQHPAMIAVVHPAEWQGFDSAEPHRSVTGFIIDGHHKAAAYAELCVPVRTILICDKTPRLPALTRSDPIDVVAASLPTVALRV